MLLFNQSWPQPAYDISSNPVINGIFRSGQRGQRRLRPPRLQSGADRVATRLPLIHHTPISRVGTTSPPYIFSKRTQYDVVLSLPCMLIFKCWPIFWTNTGIVVFFRAGHCRNNTAATTWPCFQASVFSTLHILFISKWSAWNKSTGSGTNLHVYNLIKSYLLIFVLGNILGCKSFKMKSLIRIPDRGMPSS